VTETDLEHLKRSIVSVGPNGGRGFVVKNNYDDHCIITAAHCLPEMPDCLMDELPPGYNNLIGPLEEKPSFTAEINFVDPAADIAVLSGSSDWDKALIEHSLSISLPTEDWEGPALVLSLDGRWIDLNVKLGGNGRLWVAKAREKFSCGMSGSPIIALDGTAIGVVSGSVTVNGRAVESAQPCILDCLPPRLGISAGRTATPAGPKLRRIRKKSTSRFALQLQSKSNAVANQTVTVTVTVR
jgi:hypothetical protein